MRWYYWNALVSRVCLGILGILWYPWYPLVSTNLYLVELVYFLFFGFKSLHLDSWNLGNKKMPWYLCHPFVSNKFPSLAAAIEGLGVKIGMMGSSILDIGESFLFLII